MKKTIMACHSRRAGHSRRAHYTPPCTPRGTPGAQAAGGRRGSKPQPPRAETPATCARGGGTIMHLTGGRGGAANGVVRHGVMNKNGTNKRQTGTHIMEQYRKS
jgi:hypothetical protein